MDAADSHQLSILADRLKDGDPAAREAATDLLHAVERDDKEVVLPAIEALAELDLPEVDGVLTRLRDGDDAWLSITAGWLITDRADRA